MLDYFHMPNPKGLYEDMEKLVEAGGPIPIILPGDYLKLTPKAKALAKAKAKAKAEAAATATGKVKKGSKDAKRRKSFCARSAGQMKKFPKAAKDPNSRLRQARKRWKC